MATGYLRILIICALMGGLWAAPSSSAFALEKGSTTLKPVIDVEAAYNSNIYNLSSAQADRLDANSAASQASGRFNDMESVGDLIVSPSIRLTAEAPGLAGRDLRFKPGAVYHYYLSNQKRSHLDLDLKIEQSLGGGSRLGVDIAFSPSVFKKNYLSDAIDANTDGVIADDERVYTAAEYSDLTIDATYSRRLWKSGKGGNGAAGIKSIEGEVLLGIGSRSYDDPFGNRDEDTLRAGLALDFTLRNKIDLTTSYLLEFVDTPNGTEVLLRDEPDFGEILNGDGDMIDQNVRIVERVDRSRNEHTLAVKASTTLENDWEGYVKYDIRLQDYKSTEKYDITRVDREDIRHQIRIGAEKEFDPNLTYGFGLSWTRENAGRDGVAGTDEEESKSYSRVTLSGVISYKF